MYKPLPNSLTIKSSEIEGLGLFATEDIPFGTDLGKSHMNFDGPLHRTPLGGFYNHSTKPNCIKAKRSEKYGYSYHLETLRDIKAGDEITVKYTFYDIK